MPRLAPTFAFLLVCLAPAPVPAEAVLPSLGPPELVADLERVPVQSSSSPGAMVRVGPYVYFGATDPVHGAGLWRSDGTEAGSTRVADLCPGFCSSPPRKLVAAGDRLFFTLVGSFPLGSVHQPYEDLWVSDGSSAGTRRLRRFPQSEPTGTILWELTPLGDRLLFATHDPEYGRELWISDGTENGTRRLADLCEGSCSGAPRSFVTLADRAFFLAAADDFLKSVWSTDGTAEGTRAVSEDLRTLGPRSLFVHGGRLYLVGGGSGEGSSLWVSSPEDDPLEPTVLLETGPAAPPFVLEPRFFARGQDLYVVLNGPEGGPRMWRTDGTAAGTRPAEEILAAGRAGLPGWTLAVGPKLYFWVSPQPPGSVLDPGELWVLEAGAAVAHPLPEGPSVRGCCGSGTGLGNRLLLVAHGPPPGLWITDGAPGGTRLVREFPTVNDFPQAYGLTVLGDQALFTADDGNRDHELWITDGTSAGTELLADLSPPRPSSDPRELTPVGHALYFLAGERGGETALWRTGSEGAGATLVEAATSYGILAPAGDTLFLHDGALPFQGGPEGPLAVLFPGSPVPTPVPTPEDARTLTPAPDGRLFVVRGDELWVTDGTAAGTLELYDDGPGDGLPPGIGSGTPQSPYALVVSGGTLFFVGFGEANYDLWRSDGTVAGTMRVAEGVGHLRGPVPFRGGILFTSSEPFGSIFMEPSLWWSDGTSAGTRKLRDVLPYQLAVAGDIAFFFTTDETARPWLWRTDGTRAGTRSVTRVGSRGYLGLREVAAAGETLFFTLYTPETGDELWVSDGTAAGTRLVRDLRPGPADSRPGHLSAVGDFLAFAADDGVAGHEPWITDGTAAGTVRIADLHPGPGPSAPTDFIPVDDRLYFVADDGEAGRELWVVRLGAAGEEPPPIPPDATLLEPEELAGYRLWVLIASGGTVQPSRLEPACLPETVCVSGALPGRSELFVRIVGPKPNGFLWPTLVRFSTSTIDVWIEQRSSGIVRHYRLDGVSPASSELPGLFDRHGFQP